MLNSVTRPDGLQLLVGGDVWTIPGTFSATTGAYTPQSLVKVLDYNATAGTYTTRSTSPQRRGADRHVDPGRQAGHDEPGAKRAGRHLLRADRPGGLRLPIADPDVQRLGQPDHQRGHRGAVSGSTYSISGLAGLQTTDGTYTLTIDAAGITDRPATTATATWARPGRWIRPTPRSRWKTSPPRGTPAVGAVTVVFSAPIDPATFDFHSLSLTQNGGANLITGPLAIAPTDLTDTSFSVSGLDALQSGDGSYTLAVDPSGILDANGRAVAGGDSTTWQLDTTTPVIVSLETPATNPRNIVVPSLDVTFSQAIDPATFTLSDLTLMGVGAGIPAGNLIAGDNRVQITEVSLTVYEISGFNWVSGSNGVYTLTVLGAGIQDAAGNAFSNNASSSWTMITTPPGAPAALTVSPGPPPTALGEAQVYTGSVVFSGQLSEAGLRVALYDDSTDTDLGDAIVAGQTFSRQLTLPAGDNLLQATTDRRGR